MLQKSPVTYKVSRVKGIILQQARHSCLGPGQPLDQHVRQTSLAAGKKKARTNVAALKKPPWGEVEER